MNADVLPHGQTPHKECKHDALQRNKHAECFAREQTLPALLSRGLLAPVASFTEWPPGHPLFSVASAPSPSALVTAGLSL